MTEPTTQVPSSDPDIGRIGLTMRGALKLLPLQSGAPEVLVGAHRLDRPVRWAHVAEARNVASVVKGGELLITEGRLFMTSDVEQRRLIVELAERSIAGIVLELGEFFATAPAAVVDECRAHDVVLVVLHLPVPFIEVTEAIHTNLVNHRITLMNAGQELQERLTDLVLSGGSLATLVDEVADAVRNPVVFERQHGGLVYQALHGSSEQAVTAGWTSFVRQLDSAPAALERQLPAVCGQPAGRLVVLGLQSPLDEGDGVSVERGVGALSLLIMRDRNEEDFARGSRRGFLTALLDGQIATTNVESRAVAAGFAAPAMLPIAARMSRHHRGRPIAIEERLWQLVWNDVLTATSTRRIPVLMDPGSPITPTLVVLGFDDIGRRDAVADNFASTVKKAAERHLGETDAAVLCVGPAVHTWPSVVHGLHTTVGALEGSLHSPSRLWHDAMDLDLDRLIWSLRNNPDLERFARLRLDTLLLHDRRRGTKLVTTLKVLLEQNGQKAETARALHLERQSLYNRVQRIESLLGVDLSDPDTRLGLHLALRVSRQLPDGLQD